MGISYSTNFDLRLFKKRNLVVYFTCKSQFIQNCNSAFMCSFGNAKKCFKVFSTLFIKAYQQIVLIHKSLLVSTFLACFANKINRVHFFACFLLIQQSAIQVECFNREWLANHNPDNSNLKLALRAQSFLQHA